MSEILLHYNRARMSILTDGAYISILELGGQTILFPRTTLYLNGTKKLRGGMHVCLPQFGPAANTDLTHHGFGRASKWLVSQHNQTHAILTLSSLHSSYQHITWQLDYSLPNEYEARFRLNAVNHGTESVRIAPGFHPYFPAQFSPFQLGSIHYDSQVLADPIFVSATPNAIFDNKLHLSLEQENLPIYALWSDRADAYTCIEPTAAGDALLSPVTEQQWLHANESKSYTLRIRLLS